MHCRTILVLTLSIVGMHCNATEVSHSAMQFNSQCPAKKLAPLIDNYYHECHSGIQNVKNEYSPCERFLEVFKQLMPEYDCAREVDMSCDKKYTVPAIWLLGPGQFSDYHGLVHDLALQKRYARHEYAKAREEASTLFFSDGFRHVMDAAGEEYEDEWNAHEKKGSN